MDNIKLISDEKSLDQLYKDKQLVILPWLSTSFFQALPYKNKIFMYDQNSIDNYFGSTRNEINFFNNKKINKVWMSHADQVSKLPRNFKVIASSQNSKFAIIENKSKKGSFI